MGEEQQESLEGQKSQEEKEIIDVNLVPEFLEKTIEVKSVPGFLNKIVQINNYKEKLSIIDGKKEIFYRGSSDDEYKIMPSVFRGYVEKEHIMFREMLLQNTENFYNDRTTLDKLVRMQHFGLPTRLLDITSNPLTALFFACEEEKEKNAEVIVFSVDKENINYPDSDTVASVSNLARMSYEEKGKIKQVVEKYEILQSLLNIELYKKEVPEMKENLVEEETKYIEKKLVDSLERKVVEKGDNKLEKELKKELKKELEKELEKELNKSLDRKKLSKLIQNEQIEDLVEKDNPRECLIELFNSDEDIQKLIHYIKDERPFFEDRILPKDLNRVICVKSKKDNPRIRAQAGDFLLFGKDEALNKDESNYDDVQVLTRIIIKPEYKKEIIEQLDKININRGTVYPDMPNTAEYIKNKYK